MLAVLVLAFVAILGVLVIFNVEPQSVGMERIDDMDRGSLP